MRYVSTSCREAQWARIAFAAKSILPLTPLRTCRAWDAYSRRPLSLSEALSLHRLLPGNGSRYPGPSHPPRRARRAECHRLDVGVPWRLAGLAFWKTAAEIHGSCQPAQAQDRRRGGYGHKPLAPAMLIMNGPTDRKSAACRHVIAPDHRPSSGQALPARAMPARVQTLDCVTAS